MEAIEAWASDWADKFDQGWSEESLKEWVGRKVRIFTPEGAETPRNLICTVVGYSIDTLWIEDRPVCRYSFITDEGVGIPLFAAIQVEEQSE